MKTFIILFISILLSMSIEAQNEYKDAMQDALGKYGNAASLNELQVAAAQFERIAEVETAQWLPSYYASLVYCTIVFRTQEQDKKELYIEQSQLQLDKAMGIAPEESEVYALQGMLYQALMSIDPAQYGALYAPKANGVLQTAVQLNPENPRPVYLQANMLRYMPEQFGGGIKAALPLFEKAMNLYNNSIQTNELYPSWGKKDCEHNLKACKQE